MPALTVQNAEIKTATVEVRTLTISGKQVTLAVFRQLVNGELVTDEGTLAGLPWGTVNYHPDKSCADAGEHLHVVWQDGADLRRSCVREPRFGRGAIWIDSACDWLDAAILDGWRAKDAGHWPKVLNVWFGEQLVVIDLDEQQRYALYASGDMACKAIEEIRQRADPARRAELHADVCRELAEELARRQRHHDRWAELSDLPQLFIAV